MSTPVSPPMSSGPRPVGYGPTRPDLWVEDVPHLHYEAALFLGGREIMRGNRSRVVYLANVLTDKLRDARAPIELVVLSAAVPPKSRAELSWKALHLGRVRFHVCFGGVRLRAFKLGKSYFDAELCEEVRVEGGASLRLQFENAHGSHAQAMAVLLFEREYAATWLVRDGAPCVHASGERGRGGRLIAALDRLRETPVGQASQN